MEQCSVSGYHIREAGSTAVQELAFTLRDGMEYVEASMRRGLDVDDFAPRLSFFFNAHNEFFEEICKIRAARRIWATAMRERFGQIGAVLVDAYPRPDRWLLTHRATTTEQYCPGGLPSDGGCSWRLPKSSYRFDG